MATRCPVAASNGRTTASRASLRLAAAKTVIVSAQTGAAAKRRSAERSRRRRAIPVIYRWIQRPLARPVGEEVAEGVELALERAVRPREHRAVAGEHTVAELREARAPAPAAARGGSHDRLPEAAVHGVHEEPGTAIRHAELAGRLPDGAGGGGRLQEVGPAPADGDLFSPHYAPPGS